jgi:hypothetical protein
MTRFERRSCACEICRRFSKQGIVWRPPHHYGADGLGVWYWKNPEGPCSLCYETHHYYAAFVPSVVAEFIGPKICHCCRNTISCYVLDDWQLCFGNSSDDAIKWALTDMVLSKFKGHLWHTPRHKGSGYFFGFIPRDCCGFNHGR